MPYILNGAAFDPLLCMNSVAPFICSSPGTPRTSRPRGAQLMREASCPASPPARVQEHRPSSAQPGRLHRAICAPRSSTPALRLLRKSQPGTAGILLPCSSQGGEPGAGVRWGTRCLFKQQQQFVWHAVHTSLIQTAPRGPAFAGIRVGWAVLRAHGREGTQISCYENQLNVLMCE